VTCWHELDTLGDLRLLCLHHRIANMLPPWSLHAPTTHHRRSFREYAHLSLFAVQHYPQEACYKLAEIYFHVSIHSAWSESVWPPLTQFRPLATAASSFCRRSDRSNFGSKVADFKGSQFACRAPMEKSGRYLDRGKTESVYIHSYTNILCFEYLPAVAWTGFCCWWHSCGYSRIYSVAIVSAVL